MMKKEHHTTDTSIFDFDGKDPKPYRGKEIVQAPFKSKRTQPAKQPKLAVVIRKCSSRNRGSQRQMATKDVCQQNATAQEARGNCSSSGSDNIENSDSDLDRDMLRQSHLRIGGAYGTLCGSIEACKEEEFVAEKDREVVINGKQLFLSRDICIPSPEFTFTADTIVLRIQDAKLECIIKWPLHDIESFRSCADQETGSTLIELDLNESGVHALWEKLEAFLQFDNDYLCHTISSSISNMDVSWSEQVRQITSLSDGYKSVWRPGKEEMIERLKRIHWQRQDLDNLEENCLSVDHMVQERHKDSLDGWCDIVFPKEDHDAVTVTKYDYLLLNPDEFVSDTIIDFYIKYLQSMLPEDKKERLYFFNSFFFRKLTEIDCSLQHGFEKCKSSFERVKRWTARVNIFDKDYLFIPIMQSAHWSLIIICHPGYLSAGCHDGCEWKAPVILHFDSLEGCHAGLEEPIQNYLMEAWSQKNGYHEDSGRISAVKFVAAKVPQQTNYSDCGIFLLHYVELFINEVMDGHSTDFVTDEWFNPAEASKKRAKIQQVIKCLQDEELADRGNSQHYLASNVIVSTDRALSAQRSPEFGDEDPNDDHGNLSDQIDNTFDSHSLHHESQMQVSAHTCLEQDYSEAGLDFMHSAAPSQLCHSVCFSQLQDPYSEFPMVCHAHQQEAVNDSPDYSSVEEGTNDLPKHTMLQENSSDHFAHGREAANVLPDYMISEENSIDYHAHGREAAKNALDYAMAEKSSNIRKSEAFVNIDPSVDGKVEPGFVFCSSNISQYPYDRGFPDVGNFARQNVVDEMLSSTGADKFNQSHSVCKQAIDKEMDNSVEQVNETTESFILVEKVNTQLIKGTVKASAGSSKLKQHVVGSIGAANDQLEDEDIVLMDSEEVETLHNDDDSCRLIDVEFMACEVADNRLKDEAAVVMKLRDSESLQDGDDLCKTIIMKGDVPSVRELLECGSPQRNPDNSPPRKGNISGLTEPHCISSDDESDIHYDSKVDKARKTGRQSHRRNAQEGSELVQAHAGRPVTRSASKRTEDKPEGRWLSVRRRKKKSIIEVT